MRGTSESLNLWRGSMDHRQAWVYTWSSVNPVQLRTPTLALSNTKQQSESHIKAETGGNKKVGFIWSVSMRATGLWFEPWARSRVFWSRGGLPNSLAVVSSGANQIEVRFQAIANSEWVLSRTPIPVTQYLCQNRPPKYSSATANALGFKTPPVRPLILVFSLGSNCFSGRLPLSWGEFDDMGVLMAMDHPHSAWRTTICSTCSQQLVSYESKI